MMPWHQWLALATLTNQRSERALSARTTREACATLPSSAATGGRRLCSRAMLAAAASAQCLPFAGNIAPRRAGTAGRRQLLRPPAAVADRSGGAVLDRPGFETLGPGGGPATDSSGSKLDSSGGRGLGGGAWRVLLIDSDKHTEERVVQAITAVVPGADESHAANCFHTARSLGMAIITSSPKEHAEFYCQQLWQRGCRVNMEPDSTVI
ncbi:hypothetical protein ABPG75_013664 [Micractinium tetrahymenae]